MRIFGLEITRAAPAGATAIAENRGGWRRIVHEASPGDWQRNVEVPADTALSHAAVYACVTLIAQDVGKLRAKLVTLDASTGIWSETESAAFSPVLRKPNRYQTHIQFKEWWITSKLLTGNTYVLKQRDNRGVVIGLYVLDPSRVMPLVTPDGSVYYQLSTDNISGIESTVVVPASEIIHDRANCLFHPLVGVSPIYACGVAANIGLQIETNAANFFSRGSNPSGILTAPGKVSRETAEMLAEQWRTAYSGPNAGKVAIVGEGISYSPLRMSAVDAQMIEHLKWTAEAVCSVFHVPPFKIGIGQMPTYQNGELLNQVYYSDCLQSHIEAMEAVLDEGLGLSEAKLRGRLGVELDVKSLLRMDSATQVKMLSEGVRGAILSPNEARRELDLPPAKGGDSPMIQQQNYSLAALDARDRSEDPFASSRRSTELPAAPSPQEPQGEGEKAAVPDPVATLAAFAELAAATELVTR